MRMTEKIIKFTLLVLLMLFFTIHAWAGWKEENEKINFLLDEVGQLEGVFIRNGTEHAPEEAVAHLKMKMSNAMNSWFAPDREKWTAEMFIDKVASKSSMSGELYQIRFKDGRIVNVGEWLHERLTTFKPSP